jgi:hypothetical protein
MIKFAHLSIAVATVSGLSALSGCVAGPDGGDEEVSGHTAQALCENPEGTNAMIALLANAMASELGRWEILSDMETFRGFNNQLMLRLKAGAPCTNGCATVNSLLQFQDSRLDQRFRFADGTALSSWSFASRLATGYGNQSTCKTNNWCPYEPHKLSFLSSAAGACVPQNTYSAQKPNGGNLLNPANLRNALKFTEGNGPNPFIAFASTATTASIGGGNETSTSQAAPFNCTKLNPPSAVPHLDGAACSCPGVAAPSRLVRVATNPATPNWLYCAHY